MDFSGGSGGTTAGTVAKTDQTLAKGSRPKSGAWAEPLTLARLGLAPFPSPSPSPSSAFLDPAFDSGNWPPLPPPKSPVPYKGTPRPNLLRNSAEFGSSGYSSSSGTGVFNKQDLGRFAREKEDLRGPRSWKPKNEVIGFPVAAHWCSLPPELIVTISNKIADVADFVRFRCVCKSWRSASKPHDLSPQAQLPWLLLPYDLRSSSRSFFRLSIRSIITIDLPETCNRIICGSSNGWFLLLGRTLNYSLFNPFTRSLILLPRIKPIPAGFEKAKNGLKLNSVIVPLEDMEWYFKCRAYITSSDPHTVNDAVVILKTSSSSLIRYWRPGDKDWSELDWDLPYFCTPIFYKGKLYATDFKGRTAICNLGSKPVVDPLLKLNGEYHCRFFLALPDDLLVITSSGKPYKKCTLRSTVFECHRLLEREGMKTWLRLEGAGDYTVFLTNDEHYGQWKLISAIRGAPGYKSNCFYYVVPRNYRRRRQDQQFSSDDICILEQDTCQKSCGDPFRELQTSSWISPSL